MSVASLNTLFAQAVGGDVKALFTLITGAANITSLSALNTTQKGNLVAALNEVLSIANAAASSGGAVINDNTASASQTYSSNKIESLTTSKSNAAAAALVSDGTTAGTTTWSSTKINSAISAVSTQVQTIIASAPAAYDTFKEVADYIAADTSGAAAMTASIGNRIRVDAAQSFTTDQITQGLANLVALGVAKQSDLAALSTAVGDATTDFKAAYLAARNS